MDCPTSFKEAHDEDVFVWGHVPNNSPPYKDAIKINVGVAWNIETKFSTYGAIVHDPGGMVFAKFTYSIAKAFDALLVEGLVLSCAI
ncbi:hypothetical protein J1N35_044476 [Gossypium stocksii]|uniref:Uncharacterized protein n=1 Tax=Gossypium stocksii TaxID=47602 RepID=A0A9D3ZG87_9ROSI|nr:hypothetical protein J1N35_044476 [Gossypium stocksii]